MHASIHPYIHPYIHTYLLTYITDIHTSKQTNIHTYLHTYIPAIEHNTNTNRNTNRNIYMHTYIHTSIYFIYIWLDMHISRWSIMNPTARSSTAQGEAQEGQGFGAFGAGGCLPDMACPKRSSGTRGNRRKQSHCARVPRAGGSRRSAPYSENLRNASIAVQNRRCRRLKNQIWKSNGGSDCPHRIHKLVWMCQTYSNIFILFRLDLKMTIYIIFVYFTYQLCIPF